MARRSTGSRRAGPASPSGPADPPLADGPGTKGDPDLAPPLAVGALRSGGKGIQVVAVVTREATWPIGGRARPAGRARHLLGEDFLPRQSPTSHTPGVEHAVGGHGFGGRSAARPTPPLHDVSTPVLIRPAARRVFALVHPRRLRPGHRPAAPRWRNPPRRAAARPPPAPRPSRASRASACPFHRRSPCPPC